MPPPERETNYYSLKRVKKAIFHFLLGKSFAALAGFLATVLIIRNLVTDAYVAYSIMLGITLFAGTLSSFSLQFTVQRYIPELMVNGEKGVLSTLILRLLSIRLITLCCAGIVLYLLAPLFTDYFSLPSWLREFRFLPFAFIAIAIFRFIVIILESLLLQKSTKWLMWLVMAVRILSILALVSFGGTITLGQLLLIETAVYGSGFLFALLVLVLFLKNLPSSKAIENIGSDQCCLKRIFSFSFYNYLRDILWLLSSHGSNRLIIGATLLPLQVAGFGFAQTLATTTQRYVPSTLLKNLIRPVLMARFSEEKNYAELNGSANLVFKINSFVLAPLIIVFILFGGTLTSWLSAGKYQEAGWIFVAFLFLLAIEKHQQIPEVLLNAAEKNQYLFYCNIIPAFFLLPAIFAAQWFGIGGLLFARALGIILRDLVLIHFVGKNGIPYSLDKKGIIAIISASILTLLAIYPVIAYTEPSWQVFVLLPASLLIYLFLSYLFQPFSKKERGQINRLLPVKIFIW